MSTDREPLCGARDYEYLCLACGCIAPEYQWTAWMRDDEGDKWLPAPRGTEDPMIRCPSCGWEHVDDDSGPGILDGTRSECIAYMHEQEADLGEWWDARHAEIGSSGRPSL